MGEQPLKLTEQESATRRLRVRLQLLLTQLKRNVTSAELSVRSRLQWVGSRGQQVKWHATSTLSAPTRSHLEPLSSRLHPTT